MLANECVTIVVVRHKVSEWSEFRANGCWSLWLHPVRNNHDDSAGNTLAVLVAILLRKASKNTNPLCCIIIWGRGAAN